jgi:superfamily II RNA helicase
MDAARPAMPPLLARLPPEGALGPDDALERFVDWVAETGITPYPAQEEAFLELASGKHVILSTPTGSGKSLVALFLHFRALAAGARSFYTAPTKALVSEKFFALCDLFGADSVGMLTGDASINPAAEIVCATQEVLANMALRQGAALDAPYVVMDEFHYYADRERGRAWQIPLLALPKTTFLLMSATLGNVASIAERLHARSGREVASVHRDERPVPLEFAYRETPIHESVEKLLAEGKAPVYVVHFTQRECAEQAQALTSAAIADRELRGKIAAALGGFRFATTYGTEFQRFVRAGIGVHHAGLLPRYRLLVEKLAQQGLLRVICGTDTLGVGVNIPIRTVLFTRLSKWDGEKTQILSAREFRQIAGRAGRKGFDERGWVVAQAPEHVVEKRRLEAKAEAGKRAKVARKKAPPGFVGWTAETFEQLVRRSPEALQSRFAVDHGMLVDLLQREGVPGAGETGYRALAELIALSHEDARSKRRLRRDAARVFRSLVRAEILELVAEPGRAGRRARVHGSLQRDFSLYHTLSLWLVDAVASLDPAQPDYALEVLSLVEAVLEDPRPILFAQLDRAKGELIAKLKAEGVAYEDRIARLDEASWPKPLAEFIHGSFEIFAARHPWLSEASLRPKSVAREMVESYASFDAYVKQLGIARVEGTLLRYLSEAHNTLARNVPESERTPEVYDVLAYLRGTLERVDSSLLEAWEKLLAPEPAAAEPARAVAPRPFDLAEHPKALHARIRADLHALVRALAARDFEEAATCVRHEEGDAWPAARFEQAVAPFFAERGDVVWTPAARAQHLTLIREVGHRVWDATQVLVDREGDNDWCIRARVDLAGGPPPEGPLVRVVGVGV